MTKLHTSHINTHCYSHPSSYRPNRCRGSKCKKPGFSPSLLRENFTASPSELRRRPRSATGWKKSLVLGALVVLRFGLLPCVRCVVLFR